MNMDSKYVVALDIGSSNVTMIVATLNQNRTLHIEGIEQKAVDGHGVVAGRIENAQMLSNAIVDVKKQLENDLGITIGSAYVGFSGPYVRCAKYEDFTYTKDVENKCISQDDIDSLMSRLENVQPEDNEIIIDRFPLFYTIDGKTITTSPIGSFGAQLSALFMLVLSEKEQISRIEHAVKRSGLEIVDKFVNPSIIHEAVLNADDCAEGAAVVDIGSGTTDVTIVKGGCIRYFASIPIGGQAIDNDIHSTGGITASRITEMKHKYGNAIANNVSKDEYFEISSVGRQKKSFSKWNLATIIECRLRDIAHFVMDEIKEAKLATSIPNGIVLTGGVAYTEGITDLFHEISDMEVRLPDFVNGIDEETKYNVTYPNMACVGILLHGSRKGFCKVSETIKRITVPTSLPNTRTEPEIEEEAKPNVAAPSKPKKPGFGERLVHFLGFLGGGDSDDSDEI